VTVVVNQNLKKERKNKNIKKSGSFNKQKKLLALPNFKLFPYPILIWRKLRSFGPMKTIELSCSKILQMGQLKIKLRRSNRANKCLCTHTIVEISLGTRVSLERQNPTDNSILCNLKSHKDETNMRLHMNKECNNKNNIEKCKNIGIG